MSIGREDEAGNSGFREAMSDATPLEGREKQAPAPKTLRRRRRREDASGVRFAIDRIGERVEGIAPGIDRDWLRRLRNGEVPRDARVDLHGLDAVTARRAVRETLERMGEDGGRCALVVHGRGRHSEGEPVLKDALLDWLAEAPLGERVMAFTSARGGDGGVGATYVLVRK